MILRMSALPAFLRISLVAGLTLAVAGCSSTSSDTGSGSSGGMFSSLKWWEKPEEAPKDAPPAGRIYNEGLALIKQSRFRAAASKFEEVDRNHPHSEWARKSLLMVAYSHYSAGDYDSAGTAAERFVTLHPGSEDTAYAYYLMGDSYFRQIPDIARDQARSEKALNALREVTRRYPDSPYARASEKRIEMAKDQLAGKEMEVGRFYLKQRSYIAASNRFRVVVSQHQTTRHVEEALYRLVECYMAMGVTSEAQSAASVLGHNFPESQWYKDAYSLLQTGGLKPQADEGSWITRAFKGITG